VQLDTPTNPDITASGGDAQGPSQSVQRETETSPQAQPEVEATAAVDVPVPANNTSEQTADTNISTPTADAQALPQPRKRRKLPWAAVNHPPEGEEEAVAAAPTRKPRQPRKKRVPAADPDAEHMEQEDEDEEEAQPTRKRPAAKPRAKKKAAVSATRDGEEAPAPAKKARKPRKTKGALSSEVVEGTEDEVGRIADEIVAAAVRRKPKAKRRRKATPEGEEVDGVEGEEGAVREKKRKGRPPREPTPSDAEDQTIDPDVTYMDSLAARDLRVGKLSAREKQMRTIDWDAVKQRRREEDNRNIPSKADQEKADRDLAEAGAELAASQIEQGPRFRLNAAGVMEIDPTTGVIDREGDADRLISDMVTIEDQDITARLTTRSFMKNNKRFPNEFLLPGQGQRWTRDLTDLFYDGLKSFGTDFQMISQMFPGFTRRSIKTKFTREERENPDLIREALQGQCQINGEGWNTFLANSQKTEASFADADKIKREMAQQEAEFKERIAAAQAVTLERKRQREIAGIDEDGNPVGDGANKENGKVKKKRGKNKQVAFQEEQGVEIVGEIGDDDTWGQE
jgi:transcription factor TFIIIB component B''